MSDSDTSLTSSGDLTVVRRASYGKARRRVLIFGAGRAGQLVAEEIQRKPDAGYKLIGFLDDDPVKHGQQVVGLPVLGGRGKLVMVAQSESVPDVIIAIPSASGRVIREIADLCASLRVRFRILPGLYDLITGRAQVSPIREVRIEDLLGREPVRVGIGEVASYVSHRSVLVTGAGGSIGSELCRQVSRLCPRQLVLLERDETSLYEISLEARELNRELMLGVELADISDRRRLDDIFQRYQPQVVFHAAAFKHVPLMEAYPVEAVINNVGGTLNVLAAAELHGTERFIFISTDKAVNPVNVMGLTKRVGEVLVCHRARMGSPIRLGAVRFGNVLGSRGSVVPLFIRQIERGGPVTVTHPDIVRYFMTIPEAVQLIIQAGAMVRGGEIYILDMGEPVRIVELAERLMRLSGFEPYTDISIRFTGLRPGEKLAEDLVMREERIEPTDHPRIGCVHDCMAGVPGFDVTSYVQALLSAADQRRGQEVVAMLRRINDPMPAAASAARTDK